LEAKSDTIEELLAARGVTARVSGGTVGPRVIRLFLAGRQLPISAIRRSGKDLSTALGVEGVRITQGEEAGEEVVVLEIPNPHPRPVGLLKLLPEVSPLPFLTVLLGMSDTGVPLLARLSSSEVQHVVVAGPVNSGKTSLLRSMAVSLLGSPASQAVRLLCLGSGLQLLEAAPARLLRGRVIVGEYEMFEAVHSLYREVLNRERWDYADPVVMVIDELADLVRADLGLPQVLARVLVRGPGVGVNVLAATRQPQAVTLADLLRAFPLRVAAMQPQVGRGDFAVSAPQALRFQAAFVAVREARDYVKGLDVTKNL